MIRFVKFFILSTVYLVGLSNYTRSITFCLRNRIITRFDVSEFEWTRSTSASAKVFGVVWIRFSERPYRYEIFSILSKYYKAGGTYSVKLARDVIQIRAVGSMTRNTAFPFPTIVGLFDTHQILKDDAVHRWTIS